MDAQPRLTLTSVTVTAPAPRELARFYARLLGREVTAEEFARAGEPPEAGWAQIRGGDGPTLNFEYEAQWTEPRWPSRPGGQHATQHLDIYVDELEAAVRHAVDAGARLAEFQPQHDVRVLFDPAGHPFCLFT
ncbi:MAG TPA: VOC family protein [Stackebrandtia sp.]|jgi:catechol 2,3-dioxygenase-like lactoylglutathione lyase family enzyme|uniref:VOC family protein n=1 Tax=Stackebrandtia sp. TaxID=2023065 RepID=UPI002D5FE237|nr:VOC family protein [Stackebrandtia sp.]HZE40520.1 VOC family protein [Stackebrandtia sp.]